MKSLFAFLFSSLVVILLITTTISTSNGGNETDYEALLQIKSMITYDPYEALSSWKTSFHLCDWSGVSCGKRNRRVTTLRLKSRGLEGSLSPHVGNLSFLRDLSLFNNSFQGTIPHELGHLSKLRILDLSSNNFNGAVPTNLSGCRSLETLWLVWNNFTGVWDLSTFLSNLPNLQELDLSYSGLSFVSENSSNHVNSDIQYLDLASCKLTLFPESLRSMKKLRRLDLSDNDIHGHIPDWLGEKGGNSFYYLDLSNNYITGLPQFQWAGLEILYLQSNQIEGPIPPSICKLRNLSNLDISNNSFSGLIPQCLGNISSSLIHLNVKSNQIQGAFPPSICHLGNLLYLDMSNNKFDGMLPQCFGNIISSLLMIDMGNNHFHGSIPDVYGDCEYLEGFILNGNQLQGEVPSSLTKCRYLKVLDFGNNQLNGTFPGWLGDLPFLQVLVLKSNKLHGPIETSSGIKSPFPSMQVLDISHNGFEGLLPGKYFQNFNAMKNVKKKSTRPEYVEMDGKYYSVTTMVKGVEQQFPQLFVDYMIIDLSNNRFEREIPGVIGSLTSLIVLDLCHNHLTGPIPNALGNLSEIESFDLSCNQLGEEIPQSLAEITTLEVLNLSQNNLVGRIPQGKQFNTFSGNSFEGNPELCGLPLPKKCEHPHQPKLEDDGDEDEDGEWGFTWRVVMMGYGCGTIIGFVMGYVMLSTGRPRWFNAIADAGERIIQTRHNRTRYVFIGK